MHWSGLLGYLTSLALVIAAYVLVVWLQREMEGNSWKIDISSKEFLELKNSSKLIQKNTIQMILKWKKAALFAWKISLKTTERRLHNWTATIFFTRSVSNNGLPKMTFAPCVELLLKKTTILSAIDLYINTRKIYLTILWRLFYNGLYHRDSRKSLKPVLVEIA